MRMRIVRAQIASTSFDSIIMFYLKRSMSHIVGLHWNLVKAERLRVVAYTLYLYIHIFVLMFRRLSAMR